jgi:uncharacterized damage-inducible protein DinB
MPQASAASSKAVPATPAQVLLRSFDINSRITLYLLGGLDERAWRAVPAGGKGRDIASIFVHIHSVRLMWLKAASGAVLPAPLEKDTASVAQTRKALEESGAALRRLLESALEGDGRIKNFKPDATSFIGYLIAHEAHHRGQISLLARLAGFPVSKAVNFGMWEWGVR